MVGLDGRVRCGAATWRRLACAGTAWHGIEVCRYSLCNFSSFSLYLSLMACLLFFHNFFFFVFSLSGMFRYICMYNKQKVT